MAYVVLTSGVKINKKYIHLKIQRLINQVYKLLPLREEGKEWKKSLESLLVELSGLQKLFYDEKSALYCLTIISKLKGLFDLEDQQNFQLYRKIIFQVLNNLNSLDGIYNEANK